MNESNMRNNQMHRIDLNEFAIVQTFFSIFYSLISPFIYTKITYRGAVGTPSDFLWAYMALFTEYLLIVIAILFTLTFMVLVSSIKKISLWVAIIGFCLLFSTYAFWTEYQHYLQIDPKEFVIKIPDFKSFIDSPLSNIKREIIAALFVGVAYMIGTDRLIKLTTAKTKLRLNK